ncbi:MAG: alpha-ribazole phosphatase [Firmicutes bacterium HGW-Firmicutes-7]|nr:MAG: alpha-ribazole phosphatase [Firmicutes bacterium HGW-Firmicutes-7]
MDRKIYLVRHGKIDCGKEKRYIGITDLPLSQDGIEQAKDLKAFFSNITIEKAFISPLRRCVETAEIILEQVAVDQIQIEAFKEINMGTWENQPIASIKDKHPKLYEARGQNMSAFIPPGGESFIQLQNRVMANVNDILCSTSGNILLVAHAGVNRVIISHFLDISLNDLFQIKQPYGCISELYQRGINKQWQYRLIGNKE